MLTTGMVAVTVWAALSFAGFIGHLVGDYLVQTNWMAVNKAKPIFWIEPGKLDTWGPFWSLRNEGLVAITLHALTWALLATIPMTLVSYVAFGAWIPMLWAGITLGVIYWIQDRRTPIVWFMKATGKDPSILWLLIVVDNVWHLIQIAVAAAVVVAVLL